MTASASVGLKHAADAELGAGRHMLRRLAELLALPRAPKQERELAEIVAKRIVPDAIDRLAGAGVPPRHLDFIIPPRTLSHRKSRGERLTLDESDRAMRVARLLALADTVFGDHTKALVWLGAPAGLFSGKSGFELMVSEAGARLVEEALLRIDEGYFA
jgi:putative toxin-antitoxin system antitoxin component (TIGR02293 family)